MNASESTRETGSIEGWTGRCSVWGMPREDDFDRA